jgi:catechol 2,3-dioxygenase-like lactoylglutathione lyase family enzyme
MTHRNAQPALHFVWLEVSNLARSREFYAETLGLPVQENGDQFLMVSLEGASLYLAPGYPTPGNMYLAVAVPDIDKLYQHLLEQGEEVVSPQDEGWARYIEMTDPDGYRLLLLTPAEDAA